MRTRKLRDFGTNEAERILERYVSEVEFRPMIPLGCMRSVLFKIYIESSYSDTDEQLATLIHELLHAFCEVNGIDFRNEREMEKKIEEATLEFVKLYPDFARQLLNKVKPTDENRGLWVNPILNTPTTKR